MANVQNAFLQSFTDSYLARRDRVRGIEQAINEIKRNNQLRAEQRAQQLQDENNRRTYEQSIYERGRRDSQIDYDRKRADRLADTNVANVRRDKEKAMEVFTGLDASVQKWIIKNNGGKIPETTAEMAQIANTPVTTVTKRGFPMIFPINLPGIPDETTTEEAPGLLNADDVRLAKAAELRAETAENKALTSEQKDRLKTAYRMVDDYAVADMPLARKQADTKAARQFIWNSISTGTEDEGAPMPENFLLSASGMTAAQRERNDILRITTGMGLAGKGLDPSEFLGDQPVYPAAPVVTGSNRAELPPLPGIPTVGTNGSATVTKTTPGINPFKNQGKNIWEPLIKYSTEKNRLDLKGKQSVIENRGKGKAATGSGAKAPSSDWMDKYGGMFDPKVLKDERLQSIARTIASSIPMDKSTNTRTPSVMAMIAIQDVHKAAGIDRKMYVPKSGGTVDRAVKFAKSLDATTRSKMTPETWKKALVKLFGVDKADANLESIAEHSYALTHPGYARTRLYFTGGSKINKAQGGS